MNIGVILAGGNGSRFGATIPKQYQKIKGKDIIGYVIDSFNQSTEVDHFFVVSHSDYIEYVRKAYEVTVIAGGDNRNETVYNAIEHIRKTYLNCENVIFADSARPCVKAQHLDEICSILKTHDALVTVAKITDSLCYTNGVLVDRNQYFLVQTPEAFKFNTLQSFEAHNKATAIIQQSTCSNIFFYTKITHNFKITYPEDLIILEALLEEKT